MNKYLAFYLAVSITTASYAFFNMPQQMFKQGSQMMFPAAEKAPCVCQCLVK